MTRVLKKNSSMKVRLEPRIDDEFKLVVMYDVTVHIYLQKSKSLQIR